MSNEQLKTVAGILGELFNFDGQIEELCYMSAIEGEFGMAFDDMLATLHEFIDTYK